MIDIERERRLDSEKKKKEEMWKMDVDVVRDVDEEMSPPTWNLSDWMAKVELGCKSEHEQKLTKNELSWKMDVGNVIEREETVHMGKRNRNGRKRYVDKEDNRERKERKQLEANKKKALEKISCLFLAFFVTPRMQKNYNLALESRRPLLKEKRPTLVSYFPEFMQRGT